MFTVSLLLMTCCEFIILGSDRIDMIHYYVTQLKKKEEQYKKDISYLMTEISLLKKSKNHPTTGKILLLYISDSCSDN